tara:strand:+ start:1355 stop:1879 length:525 start_codon:yes stop_codon:yes gene_type:complete
MVFDSIRKRIGRYDEIDEENYSLQGGSTSSAASLKIALIFIAPMWSVSIIIAILPPFLMQMGVDMIVIWTIGGVAMILALVLPILGYFLIQNAKIAYLAGKNLFHVVIGWGEMDWDAVDFATRGDALPIATTNDLNNYNFIKNVKSAIDALNVEEKYEAEKNKVKSVDGKGKRT